MRFVVFSKAKDRLDSVMHHLKHHVAGRTAPRKVIRGAPRAETPKGKVLGTGRNGNSKSQLRWKEIIEADRQPWYLLKREVFMVDPQEIEEEHGDEYLAVSEERTKPRITVDEAIFSRPIRELSYHPPRCLQRTAKLAEAVELMKRYSVGAVMIQDGETLVGILSERDILRKVLA
jgi:hypothetical protein